MQAFETEGLIGTGAARAVLAYLFHRIEDRLDGRPTLLIIDEGWLALDDDGFAGQLREWLKTLRKKNASVVFATQSLADIDGSAIAPAIVESCPTRLFLPNERAIEPQIAAIYRRFGLNDRQIEILARATPKRDYYCQSRRGNRLFELGLGPSRARLLRRLVQGRPGRDRPRPRRATAAMASSQPGCADRGFGWAADLIPNLTNVEVTHDRHVLRSARLCSPPSHRLVVAALPCDPRRAWIVFDPNNYAQNVLTGGARAAADQQSDHVAAEPGADADQSGAQSGEPAVFLAAAASAVDPAHAAAPRPGATHRV